MNFDLTEEQQLLGASLRRFLEREYDFDARRRIVASDSGWSIEAWRTLAELGVLGLSLPEAFGGLGGGAVDQMPVMDMIGEGLLVEPYLATVGLGAQLVARAGDDAQKQRWLPVVASGALRLAFAHTEASSRYDLARVAVRATRVGDGFTLAGEKCMALHAPCADALVVSARLHGADDDPAGIALFVIEAHAPGVMQRASRTLDGMRAADIAFDGAHVGVDGQLGAGADAYAVMDAVVDHATALICAEAVGAIRYANEATLEYLKARQQFGVPIGSFQALQHRMVDMLASYEQARSMAALACAAVDTETDAARRRHMVSAAKVKIADACRHVSQESVQLHGGMGMTDELKISHTFRRLTMIAQQFGDADHHLERFAATS